jgi:hypothetical protein
VVHVTATPGDTLQAIRKRLCKEFWIPLDHVQLIRPTPSSSSSPSPAASSSSTSFSCSSSSVSTLATADTKQHIDNTKDEDTEKEKPPALDATYDLYSADEYERVHPAVPSFMRVLITKPQEDPLLEKRRKRMVC